MFRFLLLSIFLAWFIPWVWVLSFGFAIYRPYEPDGVERYWRISGPLFSDWVELKDIPRSCQKALVAAEDMGFYEHYGIEIESIKQAMERNERRGKIRFGASTLTQQLVKNLFLSRNKSYIRKAREAVGAVLLDVLMDKKEQLVWYFNIVEFGPRIYGIKEASKAYYGKKPSQLSVDECVTLVSVLPSPVKSYRIIKTGKTSPRIQQKKERILNHL